MSINNSQRGAFAPELTGVMNGGAVTIGTLRFNPVIIIFDNQGAAPVAISVDGGPTTWRTFPAGEALVLDLRDKSHLAANFTFDLGTTFTGTGAAGPGNTFSISYIYAREATS